MLKNIPDELKAVPNWVNWKKGKVPVSSKTLKPASSTDSTTWSEFDKAVESIKKPGVLGIGFVLTNSDDFVGIDIDNCINKKGVIHPIAEFWINQFDSYTEVSPSGTGVHIIVRGPNIGSGKNLSRDLSNSNIGFEIYYTGRYFTVTGVPVPGYGECGDVSYNPCMVNIFYGTYFKKGRKELTWRPCDGALKEGSRNTTLQQTIGSITHLVHDSSPDEYATEYKEELIETILYHYNDEYLNPSLSQKEIDSHVNSAFKYLGSKETEQVTNVEEADEDTAYVGNEEFNPLGIIKEYAFVTNQNKFINKNNGSMLSREALDISTGHMKFYKKTQDGRKRVSFPEYFKLSSSKTVVANVTWSPKREEVYIDSSGCGIFNTYKPISFTNIPSSVSKADIALYMELLNHVIPDAEQREVFLDYLSFTIKHPDKKINYAIIIGSEYEGVGKDMLLRPVVNFMGTHCSEITTEMLNSDFNHFVYGTKLLIIQEIYTSSYKDKREIETRLKTMTAAPPDTLSVNMKNAHPILVDNIMNVIATTNHDDALPISNADASRRYYAIWSEVKPKPNEFYQELVDWFYKKDGITKVIGYLNQRSLKNFCYSRSPAKTLFLEKLADASKDTLYHRIKLLREDDRTPFNRDLIKVQDIINSLDDQKLNPNSVAKALSQLGLINLGTGKGGRSKKVYKKAGKTTAVNIWVNKRLETYENLSGSEIVKLYENNHPSYSKPVSSQY